MRSKLIAGLDIGSTKTCAVIGEFVDEFNRPELRILGVGQTPTLGMRKDMVTNLEEATSCIRRAVQEAELMSGAGVDRVYWLTHETNETAMALYDKVAERSGFVMYHKML